MTNFLLAFPDIPFNGNSVTTSHTVKAGLSAKNLITGGVGDQFELATATADDLTIEFDRGTTATVDHLGLIDAKQLQGSGCTRVNLRGSSGSAFAPTAITGIRAWYDSSRQVTTVSGAVSQINDLSGLGNHATQGTAASRPILSRGDLQENRVLNSSDLTQVANWTATRATVTNTSATNPLTNASTVSLLTEDSTAANSHFIQQNVKVRVVSGSTYRVTMTYKANGRNGVGLILDDGGLTSSLAYSWIPDLSSSASGALTAITFASIGDGWHTLTATLISNVTNLINVTPLLLSAKNTHNYTGDGTSGAMIAGVSVALSTTSSTYIATTDFPQFAGINGNRGMVFDGTDDFLTGTTIGGSQPYTVFQVIRSEPLTSGDQIPWSFGTGVFSMFTGASTLRLSAGSNIDATRSRGTVDVITSLVNGGSSQTFINGTSVVSGAVGASTASGVTTIGRYTDGSRHFNGYILEMLIYAANLSNTDRQSVENYLLSKYVDAPIGGTLAFNTYSLAGSFNLDYIANFSTSSAFRYWRLQLGTDSTTTYPMSKTFFGTVFDFIREPTRPYKLKRLKDDFTEKDPRYLLDLTWEDIPDLKVSELQAYLQYSATNTVILYDTNNLILPGTTCMYARVVSYNIERIAINSNVVTISFEELI